MSIYESSIVKCCPPWLRIVNGWPRGVGLYGFIQTICQCALKLSQRNKNVSNKISNANMAELARASSIDNACSQFTYLVPTGNWDHQKFSKKVSKNLWTPKRNMCMQMIKLQMVGLAQRIYGPGYTTKLLVSVLAFFVQLLAWSDLSRK